MTGKITRRSDGCDKIAAFRHFQSGAAFDEERRAGLDEIDEFRVNLGAEEVQLAQFANRCDQLADFARHSDLGLTQNHQLEPLVGDFAGRVDCSQAVPLSYRYHTWSSFHLPIAFNELRVFEFGVVKRPQQRLRLDKQICPRRQVLWRTLQSRLDMAELRGDVNEIAETGGFELIARCPACYGVRLTRARARSRLELAQITR